MNYEYLQIAIASQVATLTINRPKAMNALNPQTLTDLNSAIDTLESDTAVDVIIITGSGEKAFVAGGDISAMPDFSPLDAREFAQLGHAVMQRIENCTKPVIAAVNGFALGGGCELALSCDIRLASATAHLGLPEVSLGIIPGFGGTQRLARLVGKGLAMELILGGEMINAEEACRIGLVNHVYPAEELLGKAHDLAAKIVSRGQYAVRLGKEAINNGLEMDLARANRYEAELFSLCFATEDQTEGVDAFLNKRPAQFKGC